MQQSHLFPLIRAEFKHLLNNYIRRREVTEELDDYIQPPQLGSRAGVLGSLVLAEQALSTKTSAADLSQLRKMTANRI